jgi:hypothetical protein
MYLFLISLDNMIIEVLLLALLIQEILSICNESNSIIRGGNPHWMNGRKKY